jgi:hypothetical protein
VFLFTVIALLVFDHGHVKNELFVDSSVEHPLCDFELPRERLTVLGLLAGDDERAYLLEAECDCALLVGDSFVDLLRVVLVYLHEHILNLLALSHVKRVHSNGKITRTVLRDHDLEVTLALLHLQISVELWVTWRTHIQQVLTLDEVGSPAVTVRVPQNFEFEIFKLRFFFLFLILIFLRYFWY